jgi:NhaA family Na+:H+ antiporter
MISRPGGVGSVLRDFLRTEAAGGIILMAAAGLALIAANSPLAGVYFDIFHVRIGRWDIHHWINDGLMAVFFLMVGLEIKREFVDGHLRQWSDRALPLIAAAGGMAIPAIIFLLVTRHAPALTRGWAIPAATDIAFAIGVLALLGRRVPGSLKIFLATVAIADDLGAVLIIALAYTASISGLALLGAAAIFCMMLLLNRLGVKVLLPYLALAVLLWGAVLASGVHATVAGVLAAITIPITPSQAMPDAETSPLHRLEHALAPWVAYGVVPLFGFANAGVSLTGAGAGLLLSPLTLGIAAGLFIGKQIGIFAAIWLAIMLKLGTRPQHASWMQLYGVAVLCGIGFTMSLFIGGLAFPDPIYMDEVKVGVLGGSLMSAAMGAAILLIANSRNPARVSEPGIP